ncbi:GRIP [Parasponia andersonii]|uniref:GRIP n=1 Tax=Parasponia andersonii TaxID=3476 RepID=A0A2P5BML8_PARAD|nr:GRIP [Parasponia andersonii]
MEDEGHAGPQTHLESADTMSSASNSNNNNIALDNRLSNAGDLLCSSHNSHTHHDQLLQTVIELGFQNEYLKSQFQDFQLLLPLSIENQHEDATHHHQVVKELQDMIESLNKRLFEERQTRVAAEEALKHLQLAHSEADARAHELSLKLTQAQQKFDQETKDREEKYSDLDSKFNRLHKRAKQRIQDIQKEKDDLEARFRDVNESAERALSQQSVLQQELERTRQQANEALKAMDAERQQLRSANNKLRDNIEELRHSLQPKENAVEALQQSLLEKDQMLEDVRGLLQAAEEKRQASIAELLAKHQKNLESLEAQLADAVSDRNKATETISSLQMLVAEKESKIAEMDAATTGEAARFKASVETVKGEIAQLKHEHEKERESWEATSQALRTRLETAENNCIRAEVEVAKIRSQLESEVSSQTQMLNAKDAELAAAKNEINSLQAEFSSYKIRAHALLQKKDAELAAGKDSEQVKALEEALKEAEKEVSLACAERDKVLEDLQDAMANHDKELAERETALINVKQQIKGLEAKLDSANARNQSDREAWERNLRSLEEMWQSRYDALKVQNEAPSGEDLEKELGDLKLQYKRLKEEHNSLRDLADKMIEEKDKEISRLLDDNQNLHRSLESKLKADQNENYNTGLQKQDASNISTSAAEQQILLLARQQAQREEELAQSQRHILALQEEIEELEHENRLHSQQEAMLKAELRNMDRTQKREGVDMTYLKNVILKLLETGEVEALLPVIGMLLQFSPEEIQKCQQAYRTSADAVPSPSERMPRILLLLAYYCNPAAAKVAASFVGTTAF